MKNGKQPSNKSHPTKSVVDPEMRHVEIRRFAGGQECNYWKMNFQGQKGSNSKIAQI
jgi:hypothetical protein